MSTQIKQIGEEKKRIGKKTPPTIHFEDENEVLRTRIDSARKGSLIKGRGPWLRVFIDEALRAKGF